MMFSAGHGEYGGFIMALCSWKQLPAPAKNNVHVSTELQEAENLYTVW